MKRPLTLVLLAAAALLVFALLYKSFSGPITPTTITVPKPSAQAGENAQTGGGDLIDVTPETVCTALSTLSRIDSYSRSYTVKTLWQGGESEESLSVWQKGSNIKMSLSHGSSVKNLLILGRDMYIWYDGSAGSERAVYHKDFDYAETDRYARLLTYEELYSLDSSAITDAGYTSLLGEPCIYAEYTGYNNYVNRIYVSLSSGLLLCAEIYDGESLIYSMQSQKTELSTPSDEVFAPPLT